LKAERERGFVALKELERLTTELKDLALLLKEENRPQARWLILARVREIVLAIDGEREQGNE
jgi:hypothetical protein